MARAIGAQPNFSLDEYRVYFNIPIWAFNGIDNGDEVLMGCDHIWTQWEREQLARALRRAEQTIGTEIKFTLGEEYQVDQYHPWTNPMQLEWGWIVGGGIQGLTEVTPSASDFTLVTATITVAQSDFPGGTSEIYIIETSSGLEIVPDSVATSGTDYVISISQAKLVEWDDLENQVDSIDYDPLFPGATWLKLADLTVYREYLDVSDQADITYGPVCSCVCGTEACAGQTYTGCVWVIDGRISVVKVQMADYSAATGQWTCAVPVLCGCYEGDQVSVNYLAGTRRPGDRDAVAHLAHTYMFIQPCGCAVFDLMIQEAKNIPDILTAERINCPFGTSNGAWMAWQWAANQRHGKAFML